MRVYKPPPVRLETAQAARNLRASVAGAVCCERVRRPRTLRASVQATTTPRAGEARSESNVRGVRGLCAHATLGGSGRRSSRASAPADWTRCEHAASVRVDTRPRAESEDSPRVLESTRGGVLPERGLADVRASAGCASKNVGVGGTESDLPCEIELVVCANGGGTERIRGSRAGAREIEPYCDSASAYVSAARRRSESAAAERSMCAHGADSGSERGGARDETERKKEKKNEQVAVSLRKHAPAHRGGTSRAWSASGGSGGASAPCDAGVESASCESGVESEGGGGSGVAVAVGIGRGREELDIWAWVNTSFKFVVL
ncbi:hypothetical protein C8J57DRAFT_1458260 [Mycena rebaudengoi]|nr:hypothetical protein C8J57DRAFT_1458260 [Mycena rebaudengoi]